jgi:hypothetical protein
MAIKGGEKLVLWMNKMAAQLKKPAVVRVGFLESATYPNGTPVAMVAAIQDFGTGKIPPRPFFRNMIAKHKKEWEPALALGIKRNGYDIKKTLMQLGEGIAGQLRQSIVDTNAPALSPITVMLRGMKSHDQSLVVTGKTVGIAAQRVRDSKTNYGASTKVLVDSGHLLNSVDYEVTTP